MKTILALFAAVLLGATAARAQAEARGVFAEPQFAPSLEAILPAFSEQTGFETRLTTAPAAELVERIRSGESADLFFPASDESMRQAMGLGLVDGSLKRNVLSFPGESETRYAAAAVLANSGKRLQAMALLEWLTSGSARDVFSAQGFALP